MSDLTHLVWVTRRDGGRVNPLTYGSRAFRECYGLTDLADRLAAANRVPGLDVSVEHLPGTPREHSRRPR
jgi:hypothetical protein